MSSHDHTFLSEREIIDDIMESLSDADRYILRADSKEELIKYHHNWGQHVRNTYNMWVGGNPYVNLSSSMHEDFPDQKSHRIIEGVWELLQIVE